MRSNKNPLINILITILPYVEKYTTQLSEINENNSKTQKTRTNAAVVRINFLSNILKQKLKTNVKNLLSIFYVTYMHFPLTKGYFL